MKNDLKLFKLGVQMGEALTKKHPKIKHFYLLTEAQDSDTFTRGVINSLEVQGKETSLACMWIMPNTYCASQQYKEPCPKEKKSLLVILSSNLEEGIIHNGLMDLTEEVPFEVVVASVTEDKEKIKAIKKERQFNTFSTITLKEKTAPKPSKLKISQVVRKRREMWLNKP